MATGGRVGWAGEGDAVPVGVDGDEEDGRKGLAELCHAHGFDVTELEAWRSTLTQVDVFEALHLTAAALRHFTALREVSIIHAPRVSDCVGLNSHALTRLFIVECGLTSLRGLAGCPNLTTLNCDGNRLTNVEGLAHLHQLTDLWLNNNAITDISALAGCAALTRLHLARNRIESLGTALTRLTRLETLDLSDNLLGNFADVAVLSSLPALAHLSFADPHWGDNPLCALCNHGLYMQYQCPRLVTLDAQPVTPESKAAAESTFVKKRMYYHMRTKTVQRSVWNLGGWMEAAAGALEAQIAMAVPILTHSVRVLERHLELWDAQLRVDAGGEVSHTVAAAGVDHHSGFTLTRGTSRPCMPLTAGRSQHSGGLGRDSGEGKGWGGDDTCDEGGEVGGTLPPTATGAVDRVGARVERGGHGAVGGDGSLVVLAAEEVEAARGKLASMRQALGTRMVALASLRRGLYAWRISSQGACASLVTRMNMELYSGGNVRLEEGRPSLVGSWTPPPSHHHAHTGTTTTTIPGDSWFSSVCDLVQSRWNGPDYAPVHVTGVRVCRVLRVHNRHLRSRFEKRVSLAMTAQPALATAYAALAACSGGASPASPGGPAPTSPADARTMDAAGSGAAVHLPHASAACAPKRGVEYAFLTPPWAHDGVASWRDEGADGGGSGADDSVLALAIASELHSATDVPATDGPVPSPRPAPLPAPQHAVWQRGDGVITPWVARVVEHGMSASDAEATLPRHIPPLCQHHVIAPKPSYVPPDASFGPAGAKAGGEAGTGKGGGETGLSSAPLLPPHPTTGRATAIPIVTHLALADVPRMASLAVATAMEAAGPMSPAATHSMPPTTFRSTPRGAHAAGGAVASDRNERAEGRLRHMAATMTAVEASSAALWAGVSIDRGDGHLPPVTALCGSVGVDCASAAHQAALRAVYATAPASPSAPAARCKHATRRGVAIVAKVFTGNCWDMAAGCDTLSFASSGAATEGGGTPLSSPKRRGGGPGGRQAHDTTASLVHSVSYPRAGDSRQRVTLIQDPGLILPEYVIEYEYVWDKDDAAGAGGGSSHDSAASAEGGAMTSRTRANSLDGLVAPTADAASASPRLVPSMDRRAVIGMLPTTGPSAMACRDRLPALHALAPLIRRQRVSATLQCRLAADLAHAAVQSVGTCTKAVAAVVGEEGKQGEEEVEVVEGKQEVEAAEEGGDGGVAGTGWVPAVSHYATAMPPSTPLTGQEEVDLRVVAGPVAAFLLTLWQAAQCVDLVGPRTAGDTTAVVARHDVTKLAVSGSGGRVTMNRWQARDGCAVVAAGHTKVARLVAAQPRVRPPPPTHHASAPLFMAWQAWLEEVDAVGARSAISGSPPTTVGSLADPPYIFPLPRYEDPVALVAQVYASLRQRDDGEQGGVAGGSVPHPPPSLTTLVSESILHATTDLRLPGCSITGDMLAAFRLRLVAPKLRVLDVSHNPLGHLAGVSGCRELATLVANHCGIVHLVHPAQASSTADAAPVPAYPLSTCPALVEVEACNNDVAALDEVVAVLQACTRLHSMDMTGNPCCTAPASLPKAGRHGRGDMVAGDGMVLPLAPPALCTLAIVAACPTLHRWCGLHITPDDRTAIAATGYGSKWGEVATLAIVDGSASHDRTSALRASSMAATPHRSMGSTGWHARLTPTLIAMHGIDASWTHPFAPHPPHTLASACDAARVALERACELPPVTAAAICMLDECTNTHQAMGHPAACSPPAQDEVATIATTAIFHHVGDSAAQASLTKVLTAVGRVLTVEPRWGHLVTLDLSHAALGGDSLFHTSTVHAMAACTALRSLILDSNALGSLTLVLQSNTHARHGSDSTPSAAATRGAGDRGAVTVSAPCGPGGRVVSVALAALAMPPALEAVSLSRCCLTRLATPGFVSYPEIEAVAAVPTVADGGVGVAQPLPALVGWLCPLLPLQHLTRLDLSCNALDDAAITAARLHLLPSLHFLSLEHNRLTTFAGVRGCRSLMELYISHNRIVGRQGGAPPHGGVSEESGSGGWPHAAAVRVVQALRPEHHPRLIIADFTGNPFTTHPSYREYTIYHLRRLKVLDGVGVSVEEGARVRDRFAGRLSLEFLEDRVASGCGIATLPPAILNAMRPDGGGGGGGRGRGGGMGEGGGYDGEEAGTESGPGLDVSQVDMAVVFTALRELDCASCRLKEVEALPAALFPRVTTINLDDNVLTPPGLTGLQHLPRVTTLSLRRNRVTSLMPLLMCPMIGAPPSSALTCLPPLATTLETLCLAHNGIVDMEAIGLEHLPHLRALDLSNNDIVKVAGLHASTHLRTLNLSSNNVRAIEADALAACRSLVELVLNDNALRHLHHIDRCSGLQVVHAASNRITDFVDADALAALPYLQDINLSNNPIARKQLYRVTMAWKLPQVAVLDGKPVAGEERARAEAMFNPSAAASIPPPMASPTSTSLPGGGGGPLYQLAPLSGAGFGAVTSTGGHATNQGPSASSGPSPMLALPPQYAATGIPLVGGFTSTALPPPGYTPTATTSYVIGIATGIGTATSTPGSGTGTSAGGGGGTPYGGASWSSGGGGAGSGGGGPATSFLLTGSKALTPAEATRPPRAANSQPATRIVVPGDGGAGYSAGIPPMPGRWPLPLPTGASSDSGLYLSTPALSPTGTGLTVMGLNISGRNTPSGGGGTAGWAGGPLMPTLHGSMPGLLPPPAGRSSAGGLASSTTLGQGAGMLGHAGRDLGGRAR